MTPDQGLLIVAGTTLLVVAGCLFGPGLGVWLAAVVRRRRPPPLLGPLFAHELTRLARGGLQPRLRALYAGVLLLTLLSAYLSEFRELDPLSVLTGGASLPLDRMARFADRNFTGFAYCQLAAVALLAPVFAAGAVTDERDRGTLDYLRASLLSNRELVTGKLAARLVFVGGVALTGLPVLTLTTLFGGVDPVVQTAVFAGAVAFALSLSAYSLWTATRCESLRQTLFYVYGPLLLLMFCCACGGFGFSFSPFWYTANVLNWTANRGIDGLVGPALAFVLTHGTIALGFTFLAMGAVRVSGTPRPNRPMWEPGMATALEPRKRPRWEQVDQETGGLLDMPVGAAPRARRERGPVRAVDIPRLREQDPFLWKETYFAAQLPAAEAQTLRGLGWGLGGGYALAASFGLFAALVQAVESGGRPAGVLNLVSRIAFASATAALPLFAGVRAAGSVGRERQRRTLESLFMVPVDRSVLLSAKWLAAVRWARWWLGGVVAVGVCTLIAGGLTALGLLAAIVLAVGSLAWAAAFGVWLSVRCGTPGRATVWLLVVLFALAVGPVAGAPLVESAARRVSGESDAIGTVVSLASGPYAGWQVAFDPDGPKGADAEVVVVGGLAVGVGYGLAGFGFWWAARRRFERDGRD